MRPRGAQEKGAVNMKPKSETLARGGLLLALVTLLTAYAKVPLPGMTGYVHMGDGAVMLSGLALGPFGALVAAAGSGLADLLAGFPLYIPFTVVIKGFMAYAAAKWVRPENRLSRRNLFLLGLIFLVVPGGYFPADWAFYGLPAALSAAPWNLAQAGAGYAVCVLLLGSGLLRRTGG